MYKVVLSDQARSDYAYFIKMGNDTIIRKIISLLKEIEEHPFTGTGKPEALKFDLSGYWSRRINSEHRIVYRVNGNTVEVYVLTMRYHYNKK